MSHLLDVNALVALLWPTHVHHARIHAWRAGKTLALCPITELGFIRISTGVLNASMADARRSLADFIANHAPQFVPADARALDGFAAPNSKATTDFYLANLAQAHGLKLATFDADINHTAVEHIG